mgnify:CR=1 FL=1
MESTRRRLPRIRLRAARAKTRAISTSRAAPASPCCSSDAVTPAAASQLVDKLVQSGYLERDEDPSDRRAKLLKLSPNGIKLVNEGINERYRWMDEITKNLSADEQKKIIEALDILTNAAKRIENRE